MAIRVNASGMDKFPGLETHEERREALRRGVKSHRRLLRVMDSCRNAAGEIDVSSLSREDLERAFLDAGSVAFELMNALIALSVENGRLETRSDIAKAAGLASWRTDGIRGEQSVARAMIREEWDRWQVGKARYENDEDFGRKMHARYAKAYKNERSISNNSRKWKKERSA